jgi:hypothetical protein
MFWVVERKKKKKMFLRTVVVVLLLLLSLVAGVVILAAFSKKRKAIFGKLPSTIFSFLCSVFGIYLPWRYQLANSTQINRPCATSPSTERRSWAVLEFASTEHQYQIDGIMSERSSA